ncbi:MAG: phosphoribosylamine--glycine ligase [Candidatus Nealsonbacteria bacterium]|nr:phosphoribosylamine--glycine ligase [Candidatus Nealsonbacteria bacterium]
MIFPRITGRKNIVLNSKKYCRKGKIVNMNMVSNVLIIGSGGREHALAWKLAQSPRVNKLYVASGNGGTRNVAENIAIEATDIKGLVRFVEENTIDLTVVGPENSLALGMVDVFHSRGLRIFGPTRAAAKIEWSKAFAKRLMLAQNIPTAPFQIFRKYGKALDYIREHGAPIVVKASGLALGKGAYPCKTLGQAEEALAEIMLKRVYKEAGDEVIIEEFLDGQEISIHAFCDGKTSILMPTSQDHKPIGDGDKGKNTGGMGTIAPVPWVSSEMLQNIERQIVKPTLNALAEGGSPFIGCLYPGLKMTPTGPKVLEFNARLGDPETASYMRLLKTDLLDILDACVDGKLAELTIKWHSGFAMCVVLVSGGYPGKYKKQIPIFGITEAEKVPGVVVFHSGTMYGDQLRTFGGRVLEVTAIGKTLQEALNRADKAIHCIRFKNMQYRKDIGAKAIAMGF